MVQYDFNLHTNLLAAKELRWVVKNSLLSEFFLKNSQAFTVSKSQLGLSFLNSEFLAKNL
jgi:hypothetical protein